MMRNWSEGIRAFRCAGLTLIGVFCILQLTWYWGLKIRYDDAIQDLYMMADDKNANLKKAGDGSYEVLKDGYRYRINETKYMRNSGYAIISAEDGWIEESEKPRNLALYDKTNVILNIGFDVFCKYSYQIDIENAEGKYQIPIDRHGKLLANQYMDPKYKQKMNRILESNREEIDRLIQYADEMWNVQETIW